MPYLHTNPNYELKATAALQSEERTLFLAEGSLQRKTPDFGASSRGMLTKLRPLYTITTSAARNVPRWPGPRGRARVPAGSARAPAGRRVGGAPRPRRRPGPTGGRRGLWPVPPPHLHPYRFPGLLPRGNRAKERLLPNNSDPHRRHNAGG